MSQEINKAEIQDLSLVVRAIGSDLEHTQVRMMASVNADLLFHYWWKSHTNLTHPGKYFRPSKVKIMRPTSPK